MFGVYLVPSAEQESLLAKELYEFIRHDPKAPHAQWGKQPHVTLFGFGPCTDEEYDTLLGEIQKLPFSSQRWHASDNIKRSHRFSEPHFHIFKMNFKDETIAYITKQIATVMNDAWSKKIKIEYHLTVAASTLDETKLVELAKEKQWTILADYFVNSDNWKQEFMNLFWDLVIVSTNDYDNPMDGWQNRTTIPLYKVKY
jgi:hypothetical protein